MTVKPLASMPAATALTGSEIFYAQQAGNDVKVTANQISQSLGSFTVAALPVAPATGSTAYASDGLKMGEASGSGSGVPVYFQGVWRVLSSDLQVQS